MEKDLMPVIAQAKELLPERRYSECEAVICAAMLNTRTTQFHITGWGFSLKEGTAIRLCTFA